MTIHNQNHFPVEVIIVDDSLSRSVKNVVDYFSSKFESIGCKLKYVKGDDGLTAARNLGVKISEGDATAVPAWRNLKNGGYLIICDSNDTNPYVAFRAWLIHRKHGVYTSVKDLTQGGQFPTLKNEC